MVVPSIGNSLRYVTLSTMLDLALGVAIAYVVVRRDFRAGHLLDAAAMLPLAVPGLVMAFGYLAISREGRPLAFLNPARDPHRALGRRLLDPAAAVRGSSDRSRASADQRGPRGGCPQPRRQRVSRLSTGHATAPGPHLLAGGVFAFALSMLEVSDSLILAQRQSTFPITKAIYELFQLLGEGRWVAAALGVWAMAFLGLAIAFARSVLGRRFGGIFRV